jgi:prepilin-type N-terminal cleavage/methylation domain-containing protein
MSCSIPFCIVPVRPTPLMPGSRRGFTFIEVLVALMLAALVVGAVRGLAEVVGDHALITARLAREIASDANAERTLRDLVGSAELATRDDERFDGTSSGARFMSWCAVPRGWQERCRVELALEPVAGSPDSVALIGKLSTGERLLFRTGHGPGSIRYLGSARDGGTWFVAWRHSMAPPPAVAFVLGSDTLIVRVGDRG